MTMVSMVTMVAPRISNCGSSALCCEMNCGSTATMKMMPFGLVALVRKPVSTRRANGGGAASAAASGSVAFGAFRPDSCAVLVIRSSIREICPPRMYDSPTLPLSSASRMPSATSSM